jgi:hypothetical protein
VGGAALREVTWNSALRDGDRPVAIPGRNVGGDFRVLSRVPVSANRLNPDLPTKIEEIINKCLERTVLYDTSTLRTFVLTCNG